MKGNKIMRIVLKNQIDNYRFAVAKVIFLLVENRYKFASDVRESNLMIVYDKDKEEYIYIYISLLTKPTKYISDNNRIVIFYQKTKYSTYCNKKNKSIIQKVEMLSEEFDKQFNEAVEVAFTDTSKFLEKIRKKYRNIVEYYFWQAKKRFMMTQFVLNLINTFIRIQ